MWTTREPARVSTLSSRVVTVRTTGSASSARVFTRNPTRVSAGNLGFTDPRKSHADGPTASQASRSAGQEVYDKLHQVPWQSEMGTYGCDGTHLTIGAKRFVAAYPASLVTARQWNASFVARLPKAPPAACPTASDASDSAARMP